MMSCQKRERQSLLEEGRDNGWWSEMISYVDLTKYACDQEIKAGGTSNSIGLQYNLERNKKKNWEILRKKQRGYIRFLL